MREVKANASKPNHAKIISIINHKELKDGTFKFQVQWENSQKKTWEFSDMVEERHVETYWSKTKKQSKLKFEHKKHKQQVSNESDGEENYQSKQESREEDKNIEAKKFIKKTELKIVSNSKTIPEQSLLAQNKEHEHLEEKDNFMNESSFAEVSVKEKQQSHRNISAPQKSNPILQGNSHKVLLCDSQSKKVMQSKKIESTKNAQPIAEHTIELVAQVQSSEDLDSELDSNASNPVFRRVGKQPKMKISKHKTKHISKVSKRKTKEVDEENILEEKRKTKNSKNYKEVDLKIPAAQKVKSINFANVAKQCAKLEYVEDLLISHVIQSGMIGKCKFFKVKLKNGDCVFLRENNMRLYFPRKLQQYYQQILNKLSLCSRSVNFAL